MFSSKSEWFLKDCVSGEMMQKINFEITINYILKYIQI